MLMMAIADRSELELSGKESKRRSVYFERKQKLQESREPNLSRPATHLITSTLASLPVARMASCLRRRQAEYEVEIMQRQSKKQHQQQHQDQQPHIRIHQRLFGTVNIDPLRRASGRKDRSEQRKEMARSIEKHRLACGRRAQRKRCSLSASISRVHLCALLGALLVATSVLAALGARRDSQSATSAALWLESRQAAQQQQQQQDQGDRNGLQLLQRSANVELTRRSQRLQRDAVVSSLAGSDSAGATCGYPGSPAHASVTFNTSHVLAGTAANYACDNGYELLGPPRRICQANGTWSPIGIPFCVLNVGLGKAAMQSSTAGHGSAQKAVDGSTSPYFQASTCTMTDVENNPWWYVNLLEPYLVQIVRIDFGTACCGNRQKATIAVRVGNNRPDLGHNPLCNRYHGFIEEGKPLFLPCTRPAPGAFVSIHLEAPSGSSLSICETFIYTDHALSIEQCPSFRDQPLGSTATYNGKCYLFHNNQALSFDGARKYCESRGGTLVDETSPALQGFLSWELYRRHRNDQQMGQYWLGATRDTRSPQNWKWINGKDVQISFWNSPPAQGNCSRFDGIKGWLWSDTDCQANLNFICQYRPLSCGKPEKPTNSTLITKNIDNGTVIEYQCAPGNLLMGPKSRACLPTGFFSEFAPKCKYLDCQFPAMIPHGDYRLLNGTTSYQSVVSYFCNDGYQIFGKSVLTCDVDERWNGPPPRCEPLLCSAPVPPSNGYVTITANVTTPGTQATYDCRPGYELVGDRLLTCLQSGSWDNSFPYCREKRSLVPHSIEMNGGANLGSAVTTTTSTSTTPAPGSMIARQLPSRLPSRTAIQFPQASSSGRPALTASSSSTTTTTTTSTTSTTTPAPATSNPPRTSLPQASLNGLANQFAIQNSLAPVLNPANDFQTPQQSNGRKPSPTNTLSQFAAPQTTTNVGPTQPAAVLPPATVAINEQTVTQLISELANSQQVSQRPQRPSSNGAQLTSFATSTTSTGLSSVSRSPQSSSSPAVKFAPFGSNLASSTQLGSYDSSPLAATNSIVHTQGIQPASTNLASSPVVPSSTASSVSQPTLPVVTSSSMSSSSPSQSAGIHSQSGHLQPASVLASFGQAGRTHNNLANAKYSLDGIIAVAIFGGFIFLGAIITIIVIIIRRRKSGHSSGIDAQTISTYDSNGEHNGLYRNYQQAWENLRFASPNSQPKSSGTPGVSLMGAHVGGAAVGLKNFASPVGVPMAVGHHHMHQAHLFHGHHNMAMSGSSGGSSSQSSSLGGSGGSGSGGANLSGGADPLLRSHHAHHHHHHHRQASRVTHMPHEVEVDEDELELESERGVLSSDETSAVIKAQYGRAGDQQAVSGEGFRDTNELTINADTAMMTAGQNGGRRSRLYSTNSASRERLSANLSENRLHQVSRNHNHHGIHHHHSSSQHQRLVSNSTPSDSTRSSRASPPGDDHSLDRLAYGNNWSSPRDQAQVASIQHNSPSGQSHSAGSSASILGNANGRSNARFQ